MSTTSTILNLLQTTTHTALALQTAVALYRAWAAIINLQEYEESSEKAAKYISEAGHRLHKTRTTLTGCVVALLISLASSAHAFHPFATSSLPSEYATFLPPALSALSTYLAKRYADSFWGDKGTIPLVGGYNAGVRHTEAVRAALERLSMGWGLVGLVGVWGMVSSSGRE